MEPARCLLLATGPETPGARETLRRALGDAPLPVLLSEGGLDWAADRDLRAAYERGAVQVSLCTVSARARGWRVETAPDWIGWSGLAVWLLRHAAAGEIWTATP